MLRAPTRSLTAVPSRTRATITITASAAVEHDYRSSVHGDVNAPGLTATQVRAIAAFSERSGCEVEVIALADALPPAIRATPDAAAAMVNEAVVLVVRRGIDSLLGAGGADALFEEQCSGAVRYDTHGVAYKKLRNKLARHTTIFTNDATTPSTLGEDENGNPAGVGGSHAIADLPVLQRFRVALTGMLWSAAKYRVGRDPVTGLLFEGNLYHDPPNTGILPHTDRERSLVIGARLGEAFPLAFYWFDKNGIVQPPPGGKWGAFAAGTVLRHGDLYFMSAVATGFHSQSGPGRKLYPKHAAGGSSKWFFPNSWAKIVVAQRRLLPAFAAVESDAAQLVSETRGAAAAAQIIAP